jgi:hypothetical protein
VTDSHRTPLPRLCGGGLILGRLLLSRWRLTGSGLLLPPPPLLLLLLRVCVWCVWCVRCVVCVVCGVCGGRCPQPGAGWRGGGGCAAGRAALPRGTARGVRAIEGTSSTIDPHLRHPCRPTPTMASHRRWRRHRPHGEDERGGAWLSSQDEEVALLQRTLAEQQQLYQQAVAGSAPVVAPQAALSAPPRHGSESCRQGQEEEEEEGEGEQDLLERNVRLRHELAELEQSTGAAV